MLIKSGFFCISRDPKVKIEIFLFFIRHKIKRIAIGVPKNPAKLSLIGYISISPRNGELTVTGF